ncbi:MAG TPA: general secretion pathway protein GspB, partial [Steroidobacteraceae bacterium]|nr:general secretion pathway protein GspB [Steroidobacteraceae bacterium]
SAPSGAAPGVGSALPPASLPQTAVAAPTAAPASAKLAPAAAPAGAAANAADASAVDEDNAPASEPAASGLSTSHVRRTTAAGVPLYQDAAATPGSAIPPLRLDLHAYADRPQDRWVMINMHKLREGDSLPNGVHVDSITRDGAVLSYNGSRFLLARE